MNHLPDEPECGHPVEPGEPLYFHSRCHPDVPLTWEWLPPNILRLWCPQCGAEGGRFTLTEAPAALTCDCEGEPTDFGWPSYVPGQSSLDLVCYFCRRVICHCTLAPNPEETPSAPSD